MGNDLKQISFKRMNSDEFKVYSKWSAKAYADHLIKSGDEKFRFKALRAAKREFRDVFPEGAASADNYLYIMLTKFARNVCRYDMSIGQFYLEHCVWKRFYYHAFRFYYVFLRH